MKYTFDKRAIEKIASQKVAQVVITESREEKVFVDATGVTTISLGVKPSKEMTRRKLVLLARKIVQKAKAAGVKKIALDISSIAFESLAMNTTDIAEVMATNMEMANYSFNTFKTKPEGGWDMLDEVILSGASTKTVKEAVKRGKVIGEEVNKTRTLANMPGGSMTPRILATRARDTVKKLPVNVKVLGKKEMQRLKMGAVLGVAQGSAEEPKFIIMEYRGAPKTKKTKPIVLVGKGVTFDTGGINLKPGDHALGMNMDMSGGAAVIQTVALAARLNVKRDVIGLIPAVENMPSGSSYRPGDVLKGMSGKTIEVLNTDAEGRVILSDAITYAKKYKPSHIVDIATLTGAALVALGEECSAIFTKDDTFAEKVSQLGEESGDYVWRLPLWDEYESGVQGKVGDVSNMNSKRSHYGGSIYAAMFLYQFAKDIKAKWMHIDMAPRMTVTDEEYLSPGAAGAPVRLLLKIIEKI